MPVSTPAQGIAAIRIGRLVSGERVGIAFTSSRRLALQFGSDQEYAVISVRALRWLLAPLDIGVIRIDPETLAMSSQGDVHGDRRLLAPGFVPEPVERGWWRQPAADLGEVLSGRGVVGPIH